MKTTGFIGGGRITAILLQGFASAGADLGKISVYEVNSDFAASLKKKFPDVNVSATDQSDAAGSDLLLIALHPPVFMETLVQIKGMIKNDAAVISLAPKITVAKMASVLPSVPNIARMNPNAGTLVNKGYNPVFFAESFDEEKKGKILRIFEKVGKVPVVPEDHIEAYAVISAMGHTYFWFQLEELRRLAVSYGLTENEAGRTITEMLWGTTETLFNSGLTYDKVTDLVPVKPLAEHEQSITENYRNSLNSIYNKIKP